MLNNTLDMKIYGGNAWKGHLIRVPLRCTIMVLHYYTALPHIFTH